MIDLGRTFLQSVERSPNAVALVDGALRLSYAQWATRVGALQAGLDDLGLRPGDHLIAIMQNRWEMASLHWACQLAGVVITPLNWRSKAEEIDYCLADAEARALVFEPVAEDALDLSMRARAMLCIGVGSVRACQIHVDDWLASPALPRPRADAQSLSLMLYTSGTTGKPKGVPRRHRAERIAALAHVAQNCYRHGERTLGVMPLYHTMGVRSLIAMALIDGRFVCQPRFDAAQALATIQAERITNLYLVPTLYHDLITHPGFPEADVSSVRKLGFAGAPMPEALLHRLGTDFAPELLVNHYGSSEIYTFSVSQDALAKPGSAGLAGINTSLRVIGLHAQDPAEQVAPGEEGQIIAGLLSDEAFEGYHKRPDADERSLRDGWYFTGDTGYFDADGHLFVTGRIDDMIVSGGENISPTDIESVLSMHALVEEVAVAGMPDARWGQKVVAFIRPCAPLDANELDRYCRASDLPDYKRPREYIFVREIPKSAVGKILRRLLQAGRYEAQPQPGHVRDGHCGE